VLRYIAPVVRYRSGYRWLIGHEKFVLLNLFHGSTQIWLKHMDSREQIPGSQIDPFSHNLDLSLDDLLLNSHRVVLLLEGHRPSQQLIDENSETPQVRTEGVALHDSSENFRCSISDCAAVGHGSEVVLLGELLREAKVDQLDVPSAIYHYIIRFQVPVYHLPLV